MQQIQIHIFFSRKVFDSLLQTYIIFLLYNGTSALIIYISNI